MSDLSPTSSPIKEAWRNARQGFSPAWLKTLLLSAAVFAVIGGWLTFSDEEAVPLKLLLIPLGLIWGAIVGAVVGLPVGLFAVLWRLAGRTAWLPVLLIPFFVAVAYWVGGDLIDRSWQMVSDTARATLGGGTGFAGARVGHPIVLIVLLPILLLFALPLALATGWAVFITTTIVGIGFIIGAGILLPPLLIALSIRLARLARQSADQATS